MNVPGFTAEASLRDANTCCNGENEYSMIESAISPADAGDACYEASPNPRRNQTCSVIELSTRTGNPLWWCDYKWDGRSWVMLNCHNASNP